MTFSWLLPSNGTLIHASTWIFILPYALAFVMSWRDCSVKVTLSLSNSQILAVLKEIFS